MKIFGSNFPETGGISTKKTQASGGAKKTKSDSVAVDDNKDQVDVSSSNEQMGIIKAELDKIPDVRMDEVQALKAEVEAGTYHRDAADIADAILREANSLPTS